MLYAVNINAPSANLLQEFPENSVLISINSEEPDELFPLQLDRNDPRILTLRFSDLTKEHIYPDKILHPINKEQTLQLLQFIDKYKDKNFIIHCAAGISRSSAICLFIHETYGHELKPNFWKTSHPNNFVLGMLRNKGDYK